MNFHCRERSGRGKYYKNNPPHNNYEKKNPKNDLESKMKDRTYRSPLTFEKYCHRRAEDHLLTYMPKEYIYQNHNLIFWNTILFFRTKNTVLLNSPTHRSSSPLLLMLGRPTEGGKTNIWRRRRWRRRLGLRVGGWRERKRLWGHKHVWLHQFLKLNLGR
jgi:hypothetical protein